MLGIVLEGGDIELNGTDSSPLLASGIYISRGKDRLALPVVDRNQC